jgi:tetratricopeptide (TPR) repeat protein
MSEHELWNELGNLYFMSGTYNQAAYAYNRSIQLDSGFGRPYCNLALTYVKQGRFAEAVSLYQRSIELLVDQKEKAITWYRLGDVYRHLKDYRDAIMAYQQADQLDSTMSQECKESNQVLYGGSGEGLQVISAVQESPEPVAIETLAAVETILPEPVVKVADVTVTLTETSHIQEASGLIQAEEIHEEPPTAPLDEPAALELSMSSDIVSGIDLDEQISSPVIEMGSDTIVTDPGWIGEEGSVSSFEVEPDVYIPDYTDEQLDQWLPGPDPQPVEVLAEPDLSRLHENHLKLAPSPALAHPADWSPASSGAELTPGTDECEIPMPSVEELELDIPDDPFPEMFIVPGEEPAQPVEAAQPEEAVIEDLEEIQREITKFRQVVQSNPRNASAWDTLGTLYKSARKYREAILSYQQAVAMDPAKAPYHHHLGIIYAIEGRDEDAMKAFQEVIELDPNHSLANATIGGYYRKMGLEELAQKHIGRAMKNFYNSENEYNRACLEALCGNVEQSIELLRIALKNKQTYVDWVLRDPDLDSIRRDPRFKQLISDYAA